jgi:hypothetical protein
MDTELIEDKPTIHTFFTQYAISVSELENIRQAGNADKWIEMVQKRMASELGQALLNTNALRASQEVDNDIVKLRLGVAVVMP